MSADAVHPSSRGKSPGLRPLSAGKRSVARRFTLLEPEQRRSGERRKVPSIASGRRNARGRTSRKSCPIALPPQQARAATADRILLGSSERDRVAEGASRSGSPQSRVPRTIMTTGLAGGLTKPYKGIRPAALTRSESPPTASLFTGSR